MPASHGASLSHRSIGSTGQRDAPGKVCGVLSASFIESKNLITFQILAAYLCPLASFPSLLVEL